MGQARGRWDRKPVLTRHRDALSEIDWRDFERLLADYYRDQGYVVEHGGTGGNRGASFDGGVDLRLRRDGKLTLVQCKHENAFQTEHNVVNELLGIKVNEGADAAIVITSGEFTAAAKRFGSQGHVRLIDGVELRQMLGARLERLRPASPTPLQGAVERLAWQAVEHIASSPRARRRSRVAEVSVGLLAFKAVAGLVGILLFVFVVLPALPKLVVSLLQPATHQARANAQPRPVIAQPGAVGEAEVSRLTPEPAPMTAEAKKRDLEAKAKREAEVREYLNRVPELTHYRYSPLDQDRDPPSDPAPRPSE